MLPLAHLGIGSALSRPLSKRLPFRWLLLGTMLPDLIDKPIFFLFGLVEHLRNGGWVPGKRGFAHTAIFLGILVLISLGKKSSKWSAITLGTASHLILDVFSKMFGTHHSASGALAVLLWPSFGWEFPMLSYGVHGTSAVFFEVVGLMLLALQLVIKKFRPR